MELCRQFTRINEECVQATRGDSDGGNFSIMGGLELLAALRASSEADTTVGVPPRNGNSNAKSRTKRKADAIATASAASDDRDSVSVGSPRVPSPKVAIPSRQMAKAGGSRAGSVPAGREASVKVEDVSVESSDNAKGKLCPHYSREFGLHSVLNLSSIQTARFRIAKEAEP